jgi:UDP-N-acetylglucosamine diphosphorylase/glucosamine-1-phosphate N-acetyltransferase
MNVLLFEDDRVGQLAPLTTGRPAYAISCGSHCLLEFAQQLAPFRADGTRRSDWTGPIHSIVHELEPTLRFVRPYLKAVEAADAPEGAIVETSVTGPTLFVNARLVPAVSSIAQLLILIDADREGIVTGGDSIAAAVVKSGLVLPPFGDGAALPALLRGRSLPDVPVELPLFEFPHDVIRFHLQNISLNLKHRVAQGDFREVADGLFVADEVTLGEHLVTDTRRGPIVIDREASVGPFCYIAGPAYLGPGARVNEHAALKDGVTLGRHAKVGGEVEASIIEAFSNKQHHGFLGHSHIGSWVNLGAGTSNSDLKNTYGPVNMDYNGRKTATGMQFVGCFVGDYSKTAINTSIFTGKTIGACSMVYGFVTTNVPSFTNYARSFSQVTESPVEVAISTQARMFARRGIQQRPCDEQLLRDMFELTRGERTGYGEPLPPEPLSL